MKNAWIALIGFPAIATFFLWEEHQAHILGVLPWALLLLCPILHLFMHRGHNGHGADRGQEGGSTSQENPGMEKGRRGEK
jgi:hypothetical protein